MITVTSTHPRRGFARAMLRGTLIFLIAMSLLTAALGVALWEGLSHWTDAQGAGLAITINGHDLLRDWDITDWSRADKLQLVVLIAVAVLAVLLALPIALLAGAAALVLVLLGTLGLPLLVGLVMIAAVFAPLWLLVWWLVARSRRAARQAAPRSGVDAARTVDA